MKSALLHTVLLPLALAAALPAAEQKVDYHGFKALRVSLPAEAADIADQIESLATLLNPGNSELDLIVAPENVEKINALVGDSTVINDDVGAAFDEEGEVGTYAVPDPSYFTSYKTYAAHQQFLRDLQGSFPANSAIYTAGRSFQGRTVEGIQIWGAGGRGSRPAVVFHGTVHAREWITTMTTEYIAYQLLTLYSSNAQVRSIVDRFDFYISPIVNPDGFIYSQTTDRLWRKNRQPVSGNSCIGRDNNRNWPYQWTGVPSGASTNPCAQTYKGLAPNDAPENQGMVNQLVQLRDSRGIRLYIDFHSYGQYILWAYGYSNTAKPDNDAALRTVAQAGQAAIRAAGYNTPYTIGPSGSTLYATTGSSVDYADAVANATYSYTYELRDTGANGFTLPANQIQPTVIETWAGVLAQLARI